MSDSTNRTAIIGATPANLCTAERLVRAGISVDLISPTPAPFGLLRAFASADDAPASLRLIGNVHVGNEITADITVEEIHALTGRADLVDVLRSRGVPVTTWQGAPGAPTDWNALTTRARLAPICF